MRYPDGGGLDTGERARREQVRLAAAGLIEVSPARYYPVVERSALLLPDSCILWGLLLIHYSDAAPPPALRARLLVGLEWAWKPAFGCGFHVQTKIGPR
jgi:hypothetical protein